MGVGDASVTAPEWIGAYRIERMLGAGSFATVWLGHDEALGARVAIKVLAENWSHDLRVRERFLQEARLLWRMDHPRLVRVYSVGELPDGRPYSIMDWADGGSLGDRLQAGPIPVETALWLLREIAAGAAVLHGHGIVHRDLTPGNVLFRSRQPASGAPGSGRRAERVLIGDLGLAKALAAASGLTARAGTPGYMAPEQDDALAVVDARADVFGLGRLGVRLLCTPGPADADPRARLRPGVPPRVANVLRKAMSLRPADRYPDATAFGAALQEAAGDFVAAPAVAPPRRRSILVRLRRLVGVAAVVAVVLATSAADASPVPSPYATDASGRISVRLPDGWRLRGSGWEGRVGGDGRLAPALVMSPRPGRWRTDPTVPGAFVGLLAGGVGKGTVTQFVAEHQHGPCARAPVRGTRQGGIDWVVARYTCALGKPVIVEAAGAVPGSPALLYVQVTPPAGSDDDFVDRLLAGVAVR